MTATPWVAVLGDNCVDRYIGHAAAHYSGGNAFNVAVQLSRAGIHVRYFGAVGEDDEGSIIRQGLDVNNISTSDLVTLPGSTGVTDIATDPSGERRFVREVFGASGAFRPGPDLAATITDASWVHIGMLPNATEFRRILANYTGTVSQDCAVSDGYDHLGVAFLSAGESGVSTALLDRALAGGADIAVVTRGAAGAVASDGSTTWKQPALPTTAIDTTGAGDSFMAAFVGRRLQGDSLSEALLAGAQLAAETCAHPAGWPHPSAISQEAHR